MRAPDDGVNGEYYCINNGVVSGVAGSCSCACTQGYSGNGCETAEPCVATTLAAATGDDGNKHCVNGGTVGGTTGSCTCTKCNAGYEQHLAEGLQGNSALLRLEYAARGLTHDLPYSAVVSSR